MGILSFLGLMTQSEHLAEIAALEGAREHLLQELATVAQSRATLELRLNQANADAARLRADNAAIKRDADSVNDTAQKLKDMVTMVRSVEVQERISEESSKPALALVVTVAHGKNTRQIVLRTLATNNTNRATLQAVADELQAIVYTGTA